MDPDNPAACIVCCCTMTVLVALGVGLFFSFSSLDAYEYGLDYSAITKTINQEVYPSGYHYLGFGHSFIRYPSTVQSMEFSRASTTSRGPIQSRTDDGLQISFKATLQYQLQRNRLYDLYMKYGENYQSPCEKHVIEALNDAATRFDANSFFTSTDTINNEIKSSLKIVLNNECYADVKFFQLSSVDLPNKFENAIQATTLMDNEINTALAERNNIGIELKTMEGNATNTQKVVINKAKAEAEASIQNNKAAMTSIYEVLTSQATAYGKLKIALEMTNA